MFGFLAFDQQSIDLQKEFRELFNELADAIERHLPASRHTALALTRLEECYTWVSKEIRDQQAIRDFGSDCEINLETGKPK